MYLQGKVEGNHIIGFSTERCGIGQTSVSVVCHDIFTSDDERFYSYTNNVFNMYFKGVNPSSVSRFLVLLHKDRTFEAFTDEHLPITLRVRTKTSPVEGQEILKSQVADIEQVNLKNIRIYKSDKIILCIKVGWKFIFFFYLCQEENFEIEDATYDLAHYYRYLFFEEEFKIIENSDIYPIIEKDGWFPFIELMGGDLKQIEFAYQDPLNLQEGLSKFIESFDNKRVNGLLERWLKNDLFRESELILRSGLKAYNEGNYIAAISTLMPKVEGILRVAYKKKYQGKNVDDMDLTALCIFLKKECSEKVKSDYSLLLAEPFYNYLEKHYLTKFSLNSAEVKLGRNSLSHGVVSSDDLNQAKAIQTILILDQIFFYIT